MLGILLSLQCTHRESFIAWIPKKNSVLFAVSISIMSLSPNMQVDGIVEEINQAARGLSSDVFKDEVARKRLQRAVQQLNMMLESPVDVLSRLIFQVSHEGI